MQGVVDLLGEQAIGLDGAPYVRCLEADLDLVEAEILENADMPHGALDHRLRRRMAVLLEQFLLQRAAVDADADRHLALGAGAHHLLDLAAFADIAGVDAQAGNTAFQGSQGQAVVEVDVGHQRQLALTANLLERFGRLGIRHGAAHDFTAGRSQPADLIQRRAHVAGVGVAHRLHGHRRPAADGNIPDFDLFRLAHVIYNKRGKGLDDTSSLRRSL